MNAELPKLYTILIVEDSQSLASTYREFLRPEGYTIHHVEDGQEALDWVLNNHADAVILDLMLPDMNGIDVLKGIKKLLNDVEIMIITAHGSVDIAVDAIQSGASDFLEKPFDSARLRTSLTNMLQKFQLVSEVKTYRKEFTRSHYHNFIGSSLSMQTVYRIIDSAAPSNASIFITGETGAGKEVCAEAIHKESKRKDNPFIPINCAAIPKELMESEIFGHVKGAFTGAHENRVGAATMADTGTLFLDEVCEMDLELQSKLLRFIQAKTFHKVGSNKLEKVDIRIICATNREVLTEVESGRFREDLYYRLHVIPITLPPLRQRHDDILDIANYFLDTYNQEEEKEFKGFAKDTEAVLQRFSWPGNVRQLQNIIRNCVVLNNGEYITQEMLPNDITKSQEIEGVEGGVPKPVESMPSESMGNGGAIKPLWAVEKEVIEKAINECGGNVPRAAAMLEVSASTLYRKIQKWTEL